MEEARPRSGLLCGSECGVVRSRRQLREEANEVIRRRGDTRRRVDRIPLPLDAMLVDDARWLRRGDTARLHRVSVANARATTAANARTIDAVESRRMSSAAS